MALDASSQSCNMEAETEDKVPRLTVNPLQECCGVYMDGACAADYAAYAWRHMPLWHMSAAEGRLGYRLRIGEISKAVNGQVWDSHL
jgi:hypothetical protein